MSEDQVTSEVKQQSTEGEALPAQTTQSVLKTPLRPEAITPTQRRSLRAQAHELRPIVQIGQAGLSEGVVNATREALEQHELIKVSINGESPTERKSGGVELSEAVGAHLIQVIGRVIILYREHLPKPSRATSPIREKKDTSGKRKTQSQSSRGKKRRT